IRAFRGILSCQRPRLLSCGVRLGGSLLSPKADSGSVSRLTAYAAADSARCPVPPEGIVLTRTGRRRGQSLPPAPPSAPGHVAPPDRGATEQGRLPAPPADTGTSGRASPGNTAGRTRSLEQTGRAIPAHTGGKFLPARAGCSAPAFGGPFGIRS